MYTRLIVNTGKVAAIGSLADIEGLVNGAAGTQVSTAEEGIRFHSPQDGFHPPSPGPVYWVSSTLSRYSGTETDHPSSRLIRRRSTSEALGSPCTT